MLRPVTSDLHLAVAVGCPTVAFFLHMEMARWGHAWAPHRMIDLTGEADQPAVARKALSS
jgi:ADP-heptose:LPS heptosyltransferase